MEHQKKARRFKLNPTTRYIRIKCKPNHFASTFIEFNCKMTQLQVNLNDATTGHKLQGMSKDIRIITSWPKIKLMTNWDSIIKSTDKEWTLFDTTTTNGQKKYMKFARTKEKEFIERRKHRIHQLKKYNRQTKSSPGRFFKIQNNSIQTQTPHNN